MRDLIRLVSSAGTGHFYTTDKNKRTTPEKLEIKKFDPVIRKHVIYKEGKIKKLVCFLQKPALCGFFYAYGVSRMASDGSRAKLYPIRGASATVTKLASALEAQLCTGLSRPGHQSA